MQHFHLIRCSRRDPGPNRDFQVPTLPPLHYDQGPAWGWGVGGGLSRDKGSRGRRRQGLMWRFNWQELEPDEGVKTRH